jgi:hypothetical protein
MSLTSRLLVYLALLFPSFGVLQLSGSGLRSALAALVAELQASKDLTHFTSLAAFPPSPSLTQIYQTFCGFI